MDIKTAKQVLDELIEKFEKLSDSTVDNVRLEGERLKKALANQIDIMIKWERLFSEVRSLHDIIESEVEDAFSDAITGLLSDSYKKLSITEAKEFARCDQKYRDWKAVRLDSNSLMNECKGIIEVIQSRKYILNNITNSVVASQENHII